MKRIPLLLCISAALIGTACWFGLDRVRARRAAPPAPEVASRTVTDFGDGSMTVALSYAQVLAGDRDLYLAVDLDGRAERQVERASMDVAIVLDRSGSMGGDLIMQARAAAAGLVQRLEARDRVALVQYDDRADLLVPLTFMDAAGKRLVTAAIEGIRAGGGTNLHDGFAFGRDQLLGVPAGSLRAPMKRVILLSDGQANVGVTGTPELARVAAHAAELGVNVTTIGLGVDYNEDLMEAMAESGRGNYYYVRDGAALDAVFAGELDSLRTTVATSAELRITPRWPGVEVLEVYGYTSRHDGGGVVVPMPDLHAGEQRRLIARLRVPARAAGAIDLVGVAFGYGEPMTAARRTALTQLGVLVTQDAAAAEGSVDRPTVEQVFAVQNAQVLRAAVEAYDRGEVEKAAEVLTEQRMQAIQQAAQWNLKPEATQKLYDAIDGCKSDIAANAVGSDGAKDVIKRNKETTRNYSKRK